MGPSTESVHSLEHLVFEIANGVSGETGDAFFRSLVHHLARALDASYVFAGAFDQDAEGIVTLALHAPVTEEAPLNYKLSETPCALSVREACSYPSGVRKLFPEDRMLATLQAEGFVGTPMLDPSGRRLGLICAITQQPLPNPQLAEAVLKIAAARAGAELERKNYEEALADSE
jgi:hypothetical protein